MESERGVVYSERRTRVDNDNTGRLFEQVLATAYVAHPYQFPVIGWPSDIEAWTLDDLKDYFRTYYAPNNCTIVVAGDVTPEEIKALALEYLGDIPAQPPPAPVRTVEPPQSGTRRISVEAPAQTPLLHLAFHAGAAADPGVCRSNCCSRSWRAANRRDCTGCSWRRNSSRSRSTASFPTLSIQDSCICC